MFSVKCMVVITVQCLVYNIPTVYSEQFTDGTGAGNKKDSLN